MNNRFRVYFPEDEMCRVPGLHGKLVDAWTVKRMFPEINPFIFDHFVLKSIHLIKEDGREIQIDKEA